MAYVWTVLYNHFFRGCEHGALLSVIDRKTLIQNEK
jgi:hypothetical protein